MAGIRVVNAVCRLNGLIGNEASLCAGDLVVFYANPESKTDVDNRVVSEFGKLLIRAELGDIEHGFFNLIIRNISKAKEILTWVKGQPGVGSAFIELVQDRIELYESFKEPMDKKLTEASISKSG